MSAGAMASARICGRAYRVVWTGPGRSCSHELKRSSRLTHPSERAAGDPLHVHREARIVPIA